MGLRTKWEEPDFRAPVGVPLTTEELTSKLLGLKWWLWLDWAQANPGTRSSELSVIALEMAVRARVADSTETTAGQRAEAAWTRPHVPMQNCFVFLRKTTKSAQQTKHCKMGYSGLMFLVLRPGFQTFVWLKQRIQKQCRNWLSTTQTTTQQQKLWLRVRVVLKCLWGPHCGTLVQQSSSSLSAATH